MGLCSGALRWGTAGFGTTEDAEDAEDTEGMGANHETYERDESGALR